MDGIPAQVVEVLGRTGMRGEASSVKVRVLDGDDRGRIIRRNVVGPVDIGDQLLLMDSSREAKAAATAALLAPKGCLTTLRASRI